MSRIHVIPHTHWDQEWYFTHQDSSVLASYNFMEVIRTLESTPDYTHYHLDGQTAVIEDFLSVKPDYRVRLEKLVREKRLFIGPWYTQTDTYNVHGESIIRNLKYGIKYARERGHCMAVGYLPDTFGHNAQMPALLRGCGLDNIIFWRGIDHDTQARHSNFIWRAPSGQQVLAGHMAYGYGAAKNINATCEHLEEKIFPMVARIRARSGLNDLMLPSGGDQVNINPSLPAVLRAATRLSPDGDIYTISSLEAFVATLRDQQSQLECWSGELKAPRYTRIHKTIGSVRYDIKQLNYCTEQFLLKKLEPVVAIARAFGMNVNTEWIDIAWKSLLRSQAHDSIGGCNSDATNQDIVHRLSQAEQTAHSLWNLVVRELATSTCEDGDMMVFNPQARAWSGTLEAVVYSAFPALALSREQRCLNFSVLECHQIPGGTTIQITSDGEKEVPVAPYYRYRLAVQLKDVPSVGYCVIRIHEGKECAAPAISSPAESIENERYRLSWENHNLTLHDHVSGRTISRLLTLEDCADAGDSYDFSPLAEDVPLLCDTFEFMASQHSPLLQSMTLRAVLSLPATLDDRMQSQGKRLALPVTLHCELLRDCPHLRIRLDLDNTVCDHRLRLRINSDIHTRFSLASQPFDIIAREIVSPSEDWASVFRENPVDIETTEGIIAIGEPGKGLVINALGMKEFQVCGSAPNQVAVTLFKSVGVLGRDNLAWRPGRASGINNTTVPTPRAQLLQPMSFALTLALTDNTRHDTLRELEAAAISRPFIYQRQSLNTFAHRLDRFALQFPVHTLPQEFSLFSLPAPLMLSAVPHALSCEGTCVRMFNSGTQPVGVPPTFAHLTPVNYLEEQTTHAGQILPANSCDFILLHSGD
ncbi:glycoside hydrolase family 38 C-terminal domain-containing protein [Rahnella aquatilis]|uniref:glycoside hydrolase family 38 N-terminal domain-containing protein n=1 Tax=Rahnella aquatilis TaxID=34038 RepID=UPI000646FB30|nr:glycoside hydrolase family 38 C-terminal domain-containing protein [Rahnella aquatilis]